MTEHFSKIKLHILPSFRDPVEVCLTEKSLICTGDIDLQRHQFAPYARVSYPLSREEHDALVGDVEKMSFTMSPSFMFGFDGTSYSLEFKSASNGIRYRWWTECPEEWQPLGDLANRLIDHARKMRSVKPSSTSEIRFWDFEMQVL